MAHELKFPCFVAAVQFSQLMSLTWCLCTHNEDTDTKMYRKSRDFSTCRARNLFFLTPWVGKLQVARKCVEWSAKDCICNNGILYIVLSTPLPELLDSTLILLRESKFRGRFIPNRCPLKMSVFFDRKTTESVPIQIQVQNPCHRKQKTLGSRCRRRRAFK